MGILKGFKDSRAIGRSAVTQPMTVGFTPRPTRTGGGDAPSDADLMPIEGVALDRYAVVVRGIAGYNYDQSMLPGIAVDHGIDFDTWHRVHEGWNARIRSNPAVARRFSDIYHASDPALSS